MRVVYEKTVVEKIAEATRNAAKIGKRIEKIVLNTAELKQLSEELFPLTPVPNDLQAYILCVEMLHPKWVEFPELRVMGVLIRPEGE